MRRFIGVAVVVAAVALIPAVSPASANGGHKTKRIVLYGQTVQDNFLDLGAEGLTLGDRDVFSDDLSETRGGDVIGYDAGECTAVRIDEEFYEATFQCLVTASLPRGQITVQGLVTFTNGEPDSPALLAVTGGTRRYRNATGQVRVRFLSDTESRLVFRLRLH
jgi:hypothetical protein